MMVTGFGWKWNTKANDWELVPMGDRIDDGFGNVWELCGPDCELEIVRPGKVQCGKADCPTKPPSASLLDSPLMNLGEGTK